MSLTAASTRTKARSGVAARAGPLLLMAITLAGLALRIRPFGNSLFGDELSAYYIATNHSLSEVLHILHGHSVDLNPPLYFVLAWAAEQIGGTSAEMLRLVSLLSGAASIPLTFLLARRTVGAHAGFLAAGLVALSPFLIHYSDEARPYALLTLLVVASALALLEALRSERVAWWGAYAALSCAAIYTQYTSVFSLAAMFVWAFVTHPKARGKLVAANLVAGLFFLPWLPGLLDNLRSPGKAAIQRLDPFTLTDVWKDLGHWAFGNPYIPVSVVPGAVAKWLTAAAAGLGVVGAAVQVALGRSERNVAGLESSGRAGWALPILMLLAVPLGEALYSAFATSVWDPRNLISAWPALAVLAAGIVVRLRGLWRVGVAALLLSGFAIAAAQTQRTESQAPDYDGAAAFIAHHGRSGDPVVDVAFFTPGPFTETEVALALGPGNAPRHPVLRIGLPPLRVVLAAPPYAQLPEQPGGLVAREAVRLARHGSLFLVVPGHWPAAQIAAARVGGPTLATGRFEDFLRRLPTRFRLAQWRWFSGYYGVSVFRFQSAAAESPQKPSGA